MDACISLSFFWPLPKRTLKMIPTPSPSKKITFEDDKFDGETAKDVENVESSEGKEDEKSLEVGAAHRFKTLFTNKKEGHFFLFGNQRRCWSHVFFLLISIVDVFFFSSMELQHVTRRWFQTFFICTTKWGDDPI